MGHRQAFGHIKSGFYTSSSQAEQEEENMRRGDTGGMDVQVESAASPSRRSSRSPHSCLLAMLALLQPRELCRPAFLTNVSKSCSAGVDMPRASGF